MTATIIPTVTPGDVAGIVAYTRYVWAYNTCGNSTPVALTQSTTTCTGFSCGQTITINHVAGATAPVSKTVIYGTVTNIPGEPTKFRVLCAFVSSR